MMFALHKGFPCPLALDKGWRCQDKACSLPFLLSQVWEPWPLRNGDVMVLLFNVIQNLSQTLGTIEREEGGGGGVVFTA